MKGFFGEFKKFIMRGNVIDLAVGVIIGGAFQAIVNSLVNDVISPLIGMIGGTDFSAYSVVLKEAVTDPKTGEIVKDALMLTAASGALVPIATIVSPITSWGIPSFAATLAAPSTNQSAPFTKSTKPRAKSTN